MSGDLGRLVNQAILEERAEEALAEVAARRAALRAPDFHHAMIRLLLETAAHEDAAEHFAALDTLGVAASALDGLHLAAARRANRPEAALARLAAMEARGPQPLATFLMKWEVLQTLRRFDTIEKEVAQVLQAVPPDQPLPRAWLALVGAGVDHNRGHFSASVGRLDALLPALLAAPAPEEPAPPRRSTGRRLLRLVDDVLGQVAEHGLHVAFTGGALLGLTRENGFLPGDLDLDLAALTPGDADALEDALVASGRFERKAQPMDFGDYRVFHHRPTGLVLDLMVHRRRDAGRISLWRRPDGLVLRELLFPDYDTAWVDHPGLGRRVPVPTDAEAHLSALYGDWRTEDRTFDTTLSARNLLRRTEFIASLGRLRAATALLSGRPDRACALLGQIDAAP